MILQVQPQMAFPRAWTRMTAQIQFKRPPQQQSHAANQQ